MIIESATTLDLFRGLGTCEVCNRKGRLAACHVRAKGMGGGRRLDIAINLVAMGHIGTCQCHHRQHAQNLNPSTDDLLGIVGRREQEAIGDIEQVLDLLVRLPGHVIVDIHRERVDVVKPVQCREHVEAEAEPLPRSARRLLGRVMRQTLIWKKVKR